MKNVKPERVSERGTHCTVQHAFTYMGRKKEVKALEKRNFLMTP